MRLRSATSFRFSLALPLGFELAIALLIAVPLGFCPGLALAPALGVVLRNALAVALIAPAFAPAVGL